MEDRLPCDKHEEQIKTLFKRVDEMDDFKKILHNLDKNYAVQTQMMKEMTEHNRKQDVRLDEQHEINMNINTNLTELAEGQRALNQRVGKLEDRVNENEEKHSIDTRDIQKKGYTDILYKYALPIGVGGVLILEIVKTIKG